MKQVYANRILNTQKSFIREILKVTQNNEVISFAGGLPNPDFFPVKEIGEAATKVLNNSGCEVLQYTTTEGYYPLRQYIADRYLEKRGLKVSPEEILITSGSQQALDLVGKVFINGGDKVLLERPGYLGAIQAFSLYEPEFLSVTLQDDGPDIQQLENVLKNHAIKLFYGVPNFQNPSGITYSKEKRLATANLLKDAGTVFIEDDAYGELRFIGEDLPPIKTFGDDRFILSGSFSKIVAPGLRMGWICANKDILDKIITAKQASDLHSDYLTQQIIYQYLMDNNVDMHILRIKEGYKGQRSAMVKSIERYLPDEIQYTKPEGGMFLWLTLPDQISSMDLFNLAAKENVVFVPGAPFYIDGGGTHTVRLNYSNCSEERIEEGIKRLSESIKRLMLK